MRDPLALLDTILALHAEVRDEIVAATERHSLESMAAVDRDDDGDTIYAIDVIGEAIVTRFADALARDRAIVVVGEGLPGGRRTYPDGADPASADCWIVVDPIDGTRGLMYQKRSAWILTGVAPNRGPATSLRDIELAVQTEIPLVKQHLCDSLWISGGRSVSGERLNRLTGERAALSPRPSRATTIEQGFGNLSRFFPGPRGLLAEIDDALVTRVLGELPPGRAVAFEDQYISTGGQLYELMMGHDRWSADLRPLVWAQRSQRGLCCHPYDLCTELIARTAGVIVTDAHGRQVDAPLDVETDVSWIGYANSAIRTQVEPVLRALLQERRLTDSRG